ncbi:uncharacterized protein RHO17_012387 isoform 2-T2 [Thomomys bottae]
MSYLCTETCTWKVSKHGQRRRKNNLWQSPLMSTFAFLLVSTSQIFLCTEKHFQNPFRRPSESVISKIREEATAETGQEINPSTLTFHPWMTLLKDKGK